jgi:hypothetical protein
MGANMNLRSAGTTSLLALAFGLLVTGCDGPSSSSSSAVNGGTSTPRSSEEVNSDESIRNQYAGVYQTTSGPLTLAGGLGLFSSGGYMLIFEQSGTKRSGTWAVEGNTIRLKGEDSGDTVLRVLDSRRLAYVRNGVEVIYTIKARE